MESCIAQNIECCEIICIDDGSLDHSGEILDKYAKEYSFIRVYHTENSGVSSARNYGISLAQGKWIWFIDADDYIVENCCGSILDIAETAGNELILFDHKKTQVYERVAYEGHDRISYYNSTENVLSMETSKNYGSTPCAYWFLRNIIVQNSIKFDCTMKYSEDTKFIFQYKLHCTKGMVIDTPIYYYRQRSGSAMHSLDAEAHAYCMKQLAFLYDTYLQKEEYKKMFQRMLTARDRAVRAMLFDYCIYVRNYDLAKNELRQMEDLGFYPYKSRMGIYSKNIKGILINVFNEGLRYKWVYLFVSKLRSRKQE